MKLSNKAILISLLAATTALTACKDDKNNAAKPAEAQQAQTEQKTDRPKLAEFNRSVKIQLVARNLVENEKKEPGVAFSYEINNIGDKAIKSLSLVFAYQHQGKLVYAYPFNVNFEGNFAEKAKHNFNLVIPFSQLPEPSRAIFAEPKNEISSITVAREIEFADGTKVVVEE